MEIIKNRPIISSATRASWKDYPFATMQVGDSFFLEKGKYERKKFSVMMHSVGKRLNAKFSSKSENGGMWVQRIA